MQIMRHTRGDMTYYPALGILLIVLPSWIQGSTDCNVALSTEHNRKTIIQDVLHWTLPKLHPDSKGSPVGNGKAVTLQCTNGFIANDLDSEQYTFACQNGMFNRTYKYEDLLCRSDFHKLDTITEVGATSLNSKILKCNQPNWKVYQVKVKKPDGSLKHLYTVCVDTKTMLTKFSFKPKKGGQHQASSSPPQTHHSRDRDVWGFDQYGGDSEEKIRLSQGYSQKAQKRRLTKIFPNVQDSKREYPYYFNRGHLVAYADFNEHDEQIATVQYLNAAPQWEILNENQWSLVERESRSMVHSNPAEWEVYTGTYGNIPTTRGPLTLSALYHPDGRFKKALLYVPMLFWRLVYNTNDQTKSKVFLGVNNPEYRIPSQIPQSYIICDPIKNKGKSFEGDENYGFVYECSVSQFLNKMKSENIVK